MVGWVSGCVSASVAFCLVGTIDTDYSFYPITFKLYMHIIDVERRDPIDFGSQGQRSRQHWHSTYKTMWAQYRLQFLPNHFQTSHAHCWWWEEETYWFWVTGSKVKVNVGTLCIKPCGLFTDYSFCPITFKLHMHIVGNERKNLIDFGSRGQKSRSLCV